MAEHVEYAWEDPDDGAWLPAPRDKATGRAQRYGTRVARRVVGEWTPLGQTPTASALPAHKVSTLYAEVGTTVRGLRRRIGASQLDLAIAAGLSRPSISNLEHGRQRIQLHVLAAVAGALGVGLADLLVNADVRPSPRAHEAGQ